MCQLHLVFGEAYKQYVHFSSIVTLKHVLDNLIPQRRLYCHQDLCYIWSTA